MVHLTSATTVLCLLRLWQGRVRRGRRRRRRCRRRRRRRARWSVKLGRNGGKQAAWGSHHHYKSERRMRRVCGHPDGTFKLTSITNSALNM